MQFLHYIICSNPYYEALALWFCQKAQIMSINVAVSFFFCMKREQNVAS